MLKDRSLSVKVVKDTPNAEAQPIDYEALVETVTKSVLIGIGVYIGADTLRKVIIYTVSAKL